MLRGNRSNLLHWIVGLVPMGLESEAEMLSHQLAAMDLFSVASRILKK